MPDRFKGPSAADEIYPCAGCGKRWHYTALNDDNLGPCCADPDAEEEEKFEPE